MSDDPATGVVDRDCRVHGIDNLYIGGSSVFSTPGFQNPTYTIVQLALRLGDHLAETHRPPVPRPAGRRRRTATRRRDPVIIVDTAIARHVADGKPPIRVGMIGAGFMASGVVLQIDGVLPRLDPHRRHRQPHAVRRRSHAYEAAGQEDAGWSRQRPGARPRHRGRPRRRSPRTRCWWRRARTSTCCST